MRSQHASFLIAHQEFYDSLENYHPDEQYFITPTRACVPSDWRSWRGGAWYHYRPPGQRLPRQGWKIHLSATIPTSRATLQAVLPVLVDAGTAFKFALDGRVLQLLNSKQWSRSHAGKFVTIYPSGEPDFLRLLHRLDEVTRPYEGPYILSDRRYKDSRVVHYRYGSIAPPLACDVTGVATTMLQTPDGLQAPDVRRPYFSLPPWVTDPVAPGGAPPDTEVPTEVTLREARYRVDDVLRYTNAGGIYLAEDRANHRRVVIKEARPGVGIGPTADDAVALLQREFHILGQIADLGVGPRPIDLFQEWEHWFLVEEHIDGVTMALYQASAHPLSMKEPTVERISTFTHGFLRVFGSLARALERLHERSIVFGDLSSTNVLIAGEGAAVRLIDFEFAFTESDPPLVNDVYTPGFAPVVVGARREKASIARDRYALGAMMLSYLFPMSPLLEAKPAAKHQFLGALETDLGLPPVIPAIVARLMDDMPGNRPSCGEVARLLQDAGLAAAPAIAGTASRGAARAKPAPEPSRRDRETAAARSASYVLSTAEYDRRDRLFPGDPTLFTTNPVSVAYGACGVAAALHQVLGSCPSPVLDWIVRYPLACERQPPGLYVGLSGVAWTLLELGVRKEAAHALAMADRHPRLWDSPDLFYGVAGWGLTHLKFLLTTGDERHLARAREAAEWIWRGRQDREEGSCWHSIDHVYFGLTRGASGVCLFLLSLYLVDKEERWLRAARQALAFELAHAVESDTGGLSWPYHMDEALPLLPYWQYGSAGVGAALLRYMTVTDDPNYRRVFERVVVDVDHKYAAGVGLFMGVAGFGSFLIDCYRFTADPQYLRRAEAAEQGVRLFAIGKPTGDAYPGDGLARISCDFGTGGAGIAVFQSRLASAAAQPFMLDELYCCKVAR